MTKKADKFNESRSEFPLNDEWATPPEILDRIRKVAQIGLDPFGKEMSLVGATVTNIYNGTPETDGFLMPWHEGSNDVAFMNPPFSRKSDFAKVWKTECELLSSSGSTRTLFCVLPANTEQRFFHTMMSVPGSIMILYKSRISYYKDDGDTLVRKNGASFASVSFVYGPQAINIALQFKDMATIVQLGARP